MSDNIGEIEISEYKEGLSYGANTIRDGVNISQQDRVKSVLLPSEILNMKRLNLILKMPDYPGVRARVKYKKRQVIEEPFIKNAVLVEELRSVYDDVQEIIDDIEDEGSYEGGGIDENASYIKGYRIKGDEEQVDMAGKQKLGNDGNRVYRVDI